MKQIILYAAFFLLAGCAKEHGDHSHGAQVKAGDPAKPAESKADEEKIKANLAKLSKEDKEAAEAEKKAHEHGGAGANAVA